MECRWSEGGELFRMAKCWPDAANAFSQAGVDKIAVHCADLSPRNATTEQLHSILRA